MMRGPGPSAGPARAAPGEALPPGAPFEAARRPLIDAGAFEAGGGDGGFARARAGRRPMMRQLAAMLAVAMLAAMAALPAPAPEGGP